MDRYHIYEEIGRGQHSLVYKGREKQTVQYVAIKSVDKSKIEKVLQEVRVQHKLNHPNCLRFFKWYETRHHIWLILEFATGGSLLELLRHDGQLPESAVRVFGADLVHGLLYLHSNGVLHCDLKPSNVLLNEYGVLKLSDFALSMTLDQLSKMAHTSKRRGTPCYMAPELFTDEGVPSVASDLWSLGVVLYELVMGTPPFVSRSFAELVHLVQTSPLELPAGDELSVPFKNLLRSLLRKDPAKRITWSALLTHEFWDGMPMPAFSRIPANTAYQRYMETREYIPSCIEEDSDPDMDDANESTLSGMPEEDSLRMSTNARRNLLRESLDSTNLSYVRRSVPANSSLIPVGETDAQESSCVIASFTAEEEGADASTPKGRGPISPISQTNKERALRGPTAHLRDLQLENTDTVLDFEYRPDTPIEGDEDEDEAQGDRSDGVGASRLQENREDEAKEAPRATNNVLESEPPQGRPSEKLLAVSAAEGNDVYEQSDSQTNLPSVTRARETTAEHADGNHSKEDTRAPQPMPKDGELQPGKPPHVKHAGSARENKPVKEGPDDEKVEIEHLSSKRAEKGPEAEQDETRGGETPVVAVLERPRSVTHEDADSAGAKENADSTGPEGNPGSVHLTTPANLLDRTEIAEPNRQSSGSPSAKVDGTVQAPAKRPSVQEAAAAVLALVLDSEEDDDGGDDSKDDGVDDASSGEEADRDDDNACADPTRSDAKMRKAEAVAMRSFGRNQNEQVEEEDQNKTRYSDPNDARGQHSNEPEDQKCKTPELQDQSNPDEDNLSDFSPKTPPGSPSPLLAPPAVSPRSSTSSLTSSPSSALVSPQSKRIVLGAEGIPESAAEPSFEVDADLERKANEAGLNRTYELLEQQRLVLVPELAEQEFRGAGEVQNLLMEPHDFVVRPIVGNPITTALPVLKYNPRMLPFPNLAAHDAARLDGPELELFFSQVFRALSSGPDNSAMQVTQTLGYLYSLCTTPRLANVIVSSSLVALLIRLGTKPESILLGGESAGGAGMRSPPRSPRTPRGDVSGQTRGMMGGALGRPMTPPSPPTAALAQMSELTGSQHASRALSSDMARLASPVGSTAAPAMAASVGPGTHGLSAADSSYYATSAALSMSSVSNSAKKPSLKSQIRKLRVRVTIVLAVLIRHATFISPRLNDEGLLEAFTSFSQEEDVLPIRRYGSAGLGELLFYITANAPPLPPPPSLPPSPSPSMGPNPVVSGSSSPWQGGEGGGMLGTSSINDQWKISGAALKQLSSCLHADDETIRFYAAKTFENVLSLAPAAEQVSQGANATSLRFATAEVASRLLHATLREKAEHLRSTCAMALAHLVRVNRRLLPRLAEHDAWGFMVSGLQAVHGSPRVQQAFLNILNLVLHSSGSSTEALHTPMPPSPIRSMPAATRLGAERTTREALFGRRSAVKEGVLRALVQLLSHGQTFVVRSKASVTLTLFLQHYPSELRLLLDNKLVPIFDRMHARLRQALLSLPSSSATSTSKSHLPRAGAGSDAPSIREAERGAAGGNSTRRGTTRVEDLIAREGGTNGTLMMRRCLHALVYRVAMVADAAIASVTKAAGKLAPIAASGRAVTASSPEAGLLQGLGREALPVLFQLSASRSLSGFVCCSADLLRALSTLIRVNLNIITEGFEEYQRHILMLAESLSQNADALRMPEVALSVGQDVLPALWAASVARRVSSDTRTWCLRLAIDVLCKSTQNASAHNGAEERIVREQSDRDLDFYCFEDAVYGEDDSHEAFHERVALLQAVDQYVLDFLANRVLPRTASLLEEEAPVPHLVVNLLCFAVSKRPSLVRVMMDLGLLADYASLLPRESQQGAFVSAEGARAPDNDMNAPREVDARVLAGAKLVSSILYAGGSLLDADMLFSVPCAMGERAAHFGRMVVASITSDEEVRLRQTGRPRALMSTQFRSQHEEQQVEAVVDLVFPLLRFIGDVELAGTILDKVSQSLDDGALLATLALALEHSVGILPSTMQMSTSPWAAWVSSRDGKPGSGGGGDDDGVNDKDAVLALRGSPMTDGPREGGGGGGGGDGHDEAPGKMIGDGADNEFEQHSVPIVGELAVLLEKSCACLAMLAGTLPRSSRAQRRMLQHRRFVMLLRLVLRASMKNGGVSEDAQCRIAARTHVVDLLGILVRFERADQGSRARGQSFLLPCRGPLQAVLDALPAGPLRDAVTRILSHLSSTEG